jgi:WD40 repeat protein
MPQIEQKKKSKECNLQCVISLLLFLIVFVMSGCAPIETRPVTTVNTEIVNFIEMTPDLVPKTPYSPALSQTALLPSPISITVTPLISTITATLFAASTVTSTTIPALPKTITPLCGIELKPVPVSDLNWAPIIEKVDELQGLYTLALSPDGQFAAAVEMEVGLSSRSRIYLWELSTGNVQWVVEPEEPVATAGLAFSPDGSQLAAGASDPVPYVFVWDTASGNLLHKFSYRGSTRDISFSPDNRYLMVSGFYPTTAAIWDLEDESITELDNGNGASFIPNSTEPAVIVYKVWRLQNEPSPIFTLNLLNKQRVYLFPGTFSVDGVALSPDGQFVSTVIFDEDGNGTLKVFNLQKEVEVEVENSQLELLQVNQMTFSSLGHLAVLQGRLNLWNSNGKFLACLDDAGIHGFIFTPDGAHLLTYGIIGMPLKVWELPPI